MTSDATRRRGGIVIALALLGTGCERSPSDAATAAATDAPAPAPAAVATPARPAANPLRNAYFGDLHVHTALSVDAFITTTRTLPDDAYRYAKGEAIDHVSGQKIRLRTPLDFMAVTDHSEMIGVARAMGDPANPLSKEPVAAGITSLDYEVSQNTFRGLVAQHAQDALSDITRILGSEGGRTAVRSGWQMLQDAAAAHDEPGRFTAFVGYEWTSMPDFANLHRNVIFADATVPPLPFSSMDSGRPEDLWKFLDAWRAGGHDVLAIPHNSNASKGRMFPLVDSDGLPLTAAYAEQRTRNEPLVEVTQFKGTSETHTALAPSDEFAGFELWNTVIGAPTPVEPVPGSYVRSALQRGLQFEEQQGFNPYRFGVIGSTDSHDASSAAEEGNFTGGHGNADATPQKRLHSGESTLVLANTNFSAAGLAGVWAEENTRESIFAALRRRETFATSGPHISVRFFAGAGFGADALTRPDALENAYAAGVPMGAVLAAPAASPEFLVWANRDPQSAPLQRVQIVKGWVEAGATREAIHDVACAGGALPDAATHRCPDNGAGVEMSDCSLRGEGAASLAATWRDPDYDAAERAVYYVRVIENPSCRWSSWDAVRLGEKPPAGVAETLQERAWSSPIWVEPAATTTAASGG